MKERSSERDFGPRLPCPVLLCGASVRASAEILVNAGAQVWCTDLFHDRDLIELIERSGGRLLPRLQDLKSVPEVLEPICPSIPVICAGGLENEPEALERIEASRRLIGPSAAATRLLRDPSWLQSILSTSEVRFAESSTQAPVRTEGWLIKPLRSAAGQGIRLLPPDSEGTVAADPSLHFYQRNQEGSPFSVVVACIAGRVEVFAAALQLCGWNSLTAAEYEWCGVVGPFQLPDLLAQQIRDAAGLLARNSGAEGVWGIDMMLTGEGAVVLEVNPRVPASCWLYDSKQFHAVWQHQLGIVQESRSGKQPSSENGQGLRAQLVLRASEPMQSDQVNAAALRVSTNVRVADQPTAGQRFKAGDPVCSLLVESDDDRGQQWRIGSDLMPPCGWWNPAAAEKQLSQEVGGFISRLCRSAESVSKP